MLIEFSVACAMRDGIAMTALFSLARKGRIPTLEMRVFAQIRVFVIQNQGSVNASLDGEAATARALAPSEAKAIVATGYS